MRTRSPSVDIAQDRDAALGAVGRRVQPHAHRTAGTALGSALPMTSGPGSWRSRRRSPRAATTEASTPVDPRHPPPTAERHGATVIHYDHDFDHDRRRHETADSVGRAPGHRGLRVALAGSNEHVREGSSAVFDLPTAPSVARSGGDDRLAHRDRQQRHEADDEEDDQRNDRNVIPPPGGLVGDAEEQRPPATTCPCRRSRRGRSTRPPCHAG